MMKNRMLVIGMAALFFFLSATPAVAEALQQEESVRETVYVEYTVVKPDGSADAERVALSKHDAAELESTISTLLKTVQSANSFNEVMNAVNTFVVGCPHPWLSKILLLYVGPLMCWKPLPYRSFIISQGCARKLNPFKFTCFRIYKPFTIWHYGNKHRLGVIYPSRTVIVGNSPFHIRTLDGVQLGVMTNFVGIYLYIARPVHHRSYTFFMGTARYAAGIDIPLACW